MFQTVVDRYTINFLPMADKYPTRQHSSGMRTARLPTVRALVATLDVSYGWEGGPQVKKFE